MLGPQSFAVAVPAASGMLYGRAWSVTGRDGRDGGGGRGDDGGHGEEEEGCEGRKAVPSEVVIGYVLVYWNFLSPLSIPISRALSDLSQSGR